MGKRSTGKGRQNPRFVGSSIGTSQRLERGYGIQNTLNIIGSERVQNNIDDHGTNPSSLTIFSHTACPAPHSRRSNFSRSHHVTEHYLIVVESTKKKMINMIFPKLKADNTHEVCLRPSLGMNQVSCGKRLKSYTRL